ncbi:MAG TPA: hypothetical protein VGD72_09480 [Mycobacteriales bacterium]
MTPRLPEDERAHVAELVRRGHRGYLLRAARALSVCVLVSGGLYGVELLGPSVPWHLHLFPGPPAAAPGQVVPARTPAPAPTPLPDGSPATPPMITLPPIPPTIPPPTPTPTPPAVTPPGPLAPGAPRDVAVRLEPDVVHPAHIRLTWRAPAGGGPVTRYVVYRNGRELSSLPVPDRGYPDTGYDRLAHTYVVQARGPGGHTDSLPAVLPAAPDPPDLDAVLYDVSGAAVVSWHPATTGGPWDRYAVLRDGAEAGTAARSATAFPDHGYDGGRHTYQVRAEGPGGAATSLPMTIDPLPVAAVPAAPARVAATVGPRCGLDVGWSQPVGGGPRTAYALLRNGEEIARLGPRVTSYLDNEAGAAPEYRVRAMGPGGAATSGPATMPGLGLCASLGPSRLTAPAAATATPGILDLGAVARLAGPLPLVVDLDDSPSVPGLPAPPRAVLPGPPASRGGRRPDAPRMRLS